MDVLYAKSFDKDIDRLRRNKEILKKLADSIVEIKSCKRVIDLRNIKKLEGYQCYYRIKIGDYRLGIKYDSNRMVLLRFLHRKDVYKHFPPE